MVSDANLCPLHNLKTDLNIIMILHSYVEQVMMMCRVQELQLSFLYFLSYLSLMVKATMPSVLNTVRNIFMRLYGSVEEFVTICLIYKLWWLLCSYPQLLPPSPPPPPPPKKKKEKKKIGFFVKIHLLESSKLDLYGLYFGSYSLMISFSYN